MGSSASPPSCPALCRASTSSLCVNKTWMAGTSPAMTTRKPRSGKSDLSRRREGGFGLLDDRLKGRRLVDGEVGQDLAIDHEPGLGEAVDKSAVVEPKRPHRGIEALDPERPEGALPALAIAVGVLIGLLDRLLGDADRVLATAEIALRGLEYFLVLGVSGDTTLDAGHG